MDFVENFSCSSGPRNVQSSYWNPQTVTLHSIMVYYGETVGGELLWKSFCYMSSVPSHNTTMVVTILKSLLLTELRPLIDHLDKNKVYYITDSPVSQYRTSSFSTLYRVTSKFSGCQLCGTTSRRDTGRDLVMALGELSSVVRLKQPNKIDSL